MIPSRNFDNFPTFASAGTRVSPDNAKYAAGFVPDDTYPAFWANYFLHGATKGISDLNPVVKSLIDECNYVVTQSGQTLDATDNTQLYTAVRSFSKDRITINSDTILTVNSDTVGRITANSVITITLADSVIVGACLRVYNTSAYNQNLKARTPDGNNTTVTLLAGSQNTIEWDGAKWISGNAPAVGATFVQYPNQETPDVVYPCSKWEKVNYAGAFFRAEGGNAQAFDNQASMQGESIKSHSHTINKGNTSSDGTETTAGIRWVLSGSHSHSGRPAGTKHYSGNRTPVLDDPTYITGGAHTHTAYLYGKTDDTGGTETRPINYTMIVWKRIA